MAEAAPADIAALREGARAGRAAALAELGERMLSGIAGAPLEPREGAVMVAGAAGRGEPRALHRLAVLTALGVQRASDWPRALDLLARAAAAGWGAAQAQLRILAGGPRGDSPAPDPTDWSAMRAAVDMPAWVTPPARVILAQAPRVRAAPGFAPPAACDWLIACAAERLAPARVYDPGAGAATVRRARSNSEAEFDLARIDLVTLVLQLRIAAITGLPTQQLETPYVLHYAPGQEFTRHFDYLDEDNPAYAADIAARGQRVATFLLYLNGDYEGGATLFPAVGLTHRGARRRRHVLLQRRAGRRPRPPVAARRRPHHLRREVGAVAVHQGTGRAGLQGACAPHDLTSTLAGDLRAGLG